MAHKNTKVKGNVNKKETREEKEVLALTCKKYIITVIKKWILRTETRIIEVCGKKTRRTHEEFKPTKKKI